VVVAILVALPLLDLALAAVSWLRFGIDLPIWDDWRVYRQATMGSLAPSHLFTPENDTLYPVGKALDALAFRLLDGNAVAYQLLSMIAVLGLLLALQWRLLAAALSDRLLVAAAFAFTLPMLQPESYWGLQALAYHQALPLVCCLATLALVLTSHWRARAGSLAVAVLASISGLAYISGAFAALAVGVVLLLASRAVAPAERAALRQGAFAMLLPGLVTSMAQLWVIVGIQHGSHLPGVPMALPTDPLFWAYLAGKIGRSLLLPAAASTFSLAATAAVAALAVAAFARHLRRLAGGSRLTRADVLPATTFVSIALMAAIYLAMVAAGRANLRPPEVTSFLDTYAWGFRRFHYFWATLLWPWLVATLLAALQARNTVHPRRSAAVALLLALVAVPALVAAGVFAQPAFFRSTMEARARGIACLQAAMQRGDRIDCPELDTDDLALPVHNARMAGASFLRSLSLAPIALGSDGPPPLFRATQRPAPWSVVHDLEIIGRTGPGWALRGGADPALTFETGAGEVLARCALLQATVRLRLTEADSAQFFYRLPGQPAFTGEASKWTLVGSGDRAQEVTFEVASATGFADAFRLDPVTKAQQFELGELELRCRAVRPR
jgi:hypothetical protein